MKNKLFSFLFLIGFLWSNSSGFSQNFSGKIVDAETQNPIEKAYVFVNELEVGEFTNSLGEFEFDNLPKTNVEITVSAFGYEKQIIQLSNTYQVIQLQKLHVVLDEVVVSTPTSKLQGENITYVTSIKLNDGNQVKTNNMGEVLASLPGVAVQSTGTGISKPVVRGLSGNRVITYVDGLRIENQQWGGDHGIGATDLGIDRVEVIKGPSSLLYGSDAIGGVLYFVESNYLPKNNWQSFISTNFESNSLSNLTQFGTQVSKNNSKFNLFVGHRSSADYTVPDQQRIKVSRYNSQAIKASYGYNKKNWLLNVRYNFSRSIIGIPGHTHSDSIYPELFYTSKVNFLRSLPFQHITNHFLNTENKLYFENGYLHFQLGNTFNQLNEFEEKVTIPGISMRLNSTTTNLRYVHQFSSATELILGLQGMHQININGENASEILIPDANTTDLGLFSLFVTEKNKLKGQAGIRLDYRQISLENSSFSKYFTGLNYAIGGGYFGDKHIFRLNVSTGFRAPHTSELLANGVHHGSFQYVIGDQNLQTEQATQFDLTYEVAGEHLSMIVNPFYNQVTDFIYLQQQDSVIDIYPVFNYVQNERVDMYGVDFGVHYHPHAIHRLHLETNFSYVRAIDKNGNYIDQIPPAKWLSKIKFEFDEKEKFYVKNIVVQNTFMFAQNETGLNETASKAYNLLDVGLNGVIKSKNNDILFNTGVKNALNQTFIDHLSRFKNYGIAGPGINFYMGVKFNINHIKHTK